MAGFGGDDDRDIFDAGNSADDQSLDTNDQAGDLSEPRSREDLAVSDAIRSLGRGAGHEPAPVQPGPAAPAPAGGAQPLAEGERTLSGVMQALLDERERRQDMARQLERYQRQEQDRTRQADRPPLAQRLFEDPENALTELRDQITQPLTEQITQMRVQHDFALASVRHPEVFGDAWSAWYQKVGTGQDPVTYFAIMNSPSPGEALVEWHKEQQRRVTIGDDLEAYNRKIIEAHMASLNGGGGAVDARAVRSSDRPRDESGRFVPAPEPQAARLPTATSRLAASGNGLAERDEDGSDGAIFEAGRPERGRAR